jgi:hypothetical protein
MVLQLEVEDSYANKFVDFLKTLTYVRLKNENKTDRLTDKSDFLEFSGLWKDRDINLEHLREKAWKK